jgi:hypothetical protein
MCQKLVELLKRLIKNYQVDLRDTIMDNNEEEQLQPIKKLLQSSFNFANHNSLSKVLNTEQGQFDV